MRVSKISITVSDTSCKYEVFQQLKQNCYGEKWVATILKDGKQIAFKSFDKKMSNLQMENYLIEVIKSLKLHKRL